MVNELICKCGRKTTNKIGICTKCMMDQCGPKKGKIDEKELIKLIDDFQNEEDSNDDCVYEVMSDFLSFFRTKFDNNQD